MNWKLTLALFTGSIAVTAVCFALGFPLFFLFLFFPLIGFLPKREIRRCPKCGVAVRDTDAFCPVCGTKLE